MEKKKLLAISGSTRKNSSNEKILSVIRDLYINSLDITIFTAIDQLPHFNPDVSENELPASVITFRKMIEDADGILICTPEYVFSLPGTLKNALEWTVSSTVFSYKPCAFIIASASGDKAFESLDLIMKTLLQQEIPNGCKLLIKGSKGKVNEEGKISDETVLSQLRHVVDTLIQTIDKTNV